jgi:hypothetical protein
MGDRIEPAPDIGDQRLEELVRWTGRSGMPDVHALLLDLQQHRAAWTTSGCPVHNGSAHGAEAEELRKGIEGIIGHLPDDSRDVRGDLIRLLDRVNARDSLAHLEREDADMERVRAIVREAAADVLHPNTVDRSAKLDAIADRVAAQLTAPPPSPAIDPSPRIMGELRRALIRQLWKAVADDATCTCSGAARCPECEAMSALGLGRWISQRHGASQLSRIGDQTVAPPSGHACPAPCALEPEDLDALRSARCLLENWGSDAVATVDKILVAHRVPEPKEGERR